MTTLWVPLKALLAVVVTALASASYVGVSSTLFEIDGAGIISPVYRTVTVRNTGPERARFHVSGNLHWMSVGREDLPVATTVQIAPGEAVNFVIEVHPRLVPEEGANNVITVTVADPRDGTTLDAATVGIRVIKRRQPTPSVIVITPSPTPNPSARVRSTPRPVPTVRARQTPPVRTFAPVLPSRSVRPVPAVSPKPTRDGSLLELLRRWFQ